MKITRRAFTIIELMVAVTILSIVTTLVIVNFTQSRRNSRDGVRKADVSAVEVAVQQYAIANGSTLIRYPVNGRPGACTIGSATDPSTGWTGAAQQCVGAGGRAYGKINLKQVTGVSGDNLGVGGVTNHRDYPTYSIVEALKDGGYFDVTPHDPSSPNGATTDPTQRDYSLIRACRKTGFQNVATGGDLFAVWAILENPLNQVEIENNRLLPGSSSAVDPTLTSGSLYQYDFAAGQSDEALYESAGYGVGNASVGSAIGPQPQQLATQTENCGSLPLDRKS